MRLTPQIFAQVPIEENFTPARTFPDIGTLISVLLKNTMIIAGVVAFIFIIVAGHRAIQTAGNAEGEQAANHMQTLTSAIVGLVIIIGAYWVIEIIQYVTGVKILGGIGF